MAPRRIGQAERVPGREERIAENETRFRQANEDLRARWDELEVERPELTLFLCECGDRTCTEIIRMTLADHESAVASPPMASLHRRAQNELMFARSTRSYAI